MGEYLYKLIERKKDLQKKLQGYNTFVDKGFGKRDYFARRHSTYEKANELRKEIKILNKKIDFALNLSDVIERKKYEEQIGESNIDF
jgi:hypothetical protein